MQVLLQLLDLISIPRDGKEKRTSERPKSIPTKIKRYRTKRNKNQEGKLLLKNILGSKTGCPLLFLLFWFFVFLTENTVHFGKVINHNAIEKGFSTLQGNLCVSAVHTPSNLVTGNVKAYFIEN